MPSKLFGQYQQEQVQQINYLPYTGKISEMLATAGGNLAEGIVEGIKTYQANEDLTQFNKIQGENLAPILLSMRGEASKSKELQAFLPEIDAQVKALTDANGKSPKVAAGVIQGVGAYIAGFNARFQTQQNLQNVNTASDITNNFVTNVQGRRPVTLNSSDVDYNGDLTHWQNISNFNDYLDKAESEGKAQGITVDRKQATVEWLKGKLDFIENNPVENLSPEKRDKLIEILSSEIESIDAGEFADGSPYDPSKTQDSTFTINDANGNPVTLNVPTKVTPTPTETARAPTATPVATGTRLPTGIPSSAITRESVGAPAPVLINPSAPAKVTPTSKPVVTAPAKVVPFVSDSATPPAFNPQSILEPIPETVKPPAQPSKTDDDLLFEPLSNRETGTEIPSSYWERPAQDTIEVEANGQMTPAQIRKYEYLNSENIDNEGRIDQAIVDYGVKQPNGKFQIKVDRKPTDQEIIERKKEEIEQGKAGRYMGAPSALAPEKVDVNPMRSSKMAMALPMPAGVTPTKVAPIKTTTPTGRPRTPEQIQAAKVNQANKGFIKDHEVIIGNAGLSKQWADKFLTDIAENPDNPKSIDYGWYGGFTMKNPTAGDLLAVAGTVASLVLPSTGVYKTAKAYKAVAGETALANTLQKVSNKLIEKGVSPEKAFDEALKTVNSIKQTEQLIGAGKLSGVAVGVWGAAEAGFLSEFGAATSDFAMPNLDEVYNADGKEELKQLSEELVDKIREIRGGGFQFGRDKWEGLTNGQRQVKLFKIEDAVNEYKTKVETIQQGAMTARRNIIAKPLTRGDIMNGKTMSDGVSKTTAILEKTQPSKKVVIRTEGQQDINAGYQDYKTQLSFEEQKDKMKKFMVQKYGYVPSGFEQMFKGMHPEADFQTMQSNGVTFYRDATKGWTPLPQKEVQQRSLKQQAEDSAFFFGTPNTRGEVVHREFIEGSGVYLRGLFRGTEKQLNEFYEKYDGLIRARKVTKRLQEINDMFGESMPWNQAVKGEAEAIIAELKSAYRVEIIGVGTVSNYEQELIASVIANPTTFWSWESSDKAKFLAILNRTNDRIQKLPSMHGLEVKQITEKGDNVEASLRGNFTKSSTKSKRMLEWEAKHPELAGLDNSGKKKQIVIPE